MVKKTKSSSRIRIFSPVEKFCFWGLNFICATLIGTGLYAFYQNSNLQIYKNEEPVALVSAKVKTARRCTEKRLIWDYLQTESKIYNGDTIRTEDGSQTTLRFEDGLELTLAGNTMTQIRLSEDKKLEIMLSGGNLLVDAVKTTKTASIVYNNTRVSMSGKALVSAAEIENQTASKNGLEVQVLDGKASVKSDKTEAVEVNDGQMVTISVTEEVSEPVSVDKAVTEVIVVKEDEKNALTPEVTVDVSKSKLFTSTEIKEALQKVPVIKTEPSKTKTINKVVKLIQKKTAEPEVKVVKEVPKKVTAVARVKLNKPEAGKVFKDSYFISNQKINFEWSSVKGATEYNLVIRSPKGEVIADKNLGNKTSWSFSELSRLSNGTFTWTIQPVFKGKPLGEKKSSTFVIKLGSISGSGTTSGQMYGNGR